MPDTTFDASDYWKDRLEQSFDLTGVGFKRRSAEYNRWVYLVRTETLDRLFEQNHWECDGKAVLDVGCGTGYFIDHWSKRHAEHVFGLDVTEVSVERLTKRFPDAEFACADITAPDLKIDRTFDYISIFDVLYHVVDDRRFEQAVKNLSRLSKRNSKVIITDWFQESEAKVVKHVRNRSKGRYTEIFSKNGFKLLHIKPLFFTLMPPTGLASKPAYWTGVLGWEALTFMARWNWAGRLLGKWLYRIDSTLQRRYDRGPSHHIAVFEYVGTE